MNAIEARAAGLRIALVRDVPLPNEPWYLTSEEAILLATQLLLAVNDVSNRTPSGRGKVVTRQRITP